MSIDDYTAREELWTQDNTSFIIDSRLLFEVGVLRPDFLTLSTFAFKVFAEVGGVAVAALATARV
jgi:hypothetical protein